MDQKEIFLRTEGDRWFKRNSEAFRKYKTAEDVLLYKKYLKKGWKVLEIGCSKGAKLDYYGRELGCTCYGIDPSAEAIEKGMRQYPSISLAIGTSDDLPFDDDFFDAVIFGFCLYLIDRKYLFRSIAEADRVLKNKGFVGITDFDVRVPKKRPYKHFPGTFSYKMDYPQLFLSSPHFSLVDKRSYSMHSGAFCEDITRRVCSTLLFKDTDAGYIDEEDR